MNILTAKSGLSVIFFTHSHTVKAVLLLLPGFCCNVVLSDAQRAYSTPHFYNKILAFPQIFSISSVIFLHFLYYSIFKYIYTLL